MIFIVSLISSVEHKNDTSFRMDSKAVTLKNYESAKGVTSKAIAVLTQTEASISMQIAILIYFLILIHPQGMVVALGVHLF